MSPETHSEQAEAHAGAQQVFERYLVEQAPQLQEVRDRQPELLLASQEIIDTFSIEPGLFDDTGRALVFTAIANRWSKVEDIQPEQQKAEKNFLADATGLLAYEYSPKLAEVKAAIEAVDGGVSGESERKVYDKYTDKELSMEMRTIIDEGLLDEVKSRLGITSENEDPFELRVLSIDTVGSTDGLSDKPTPNDELPEDPKEWAAALKENNRGFEAVKDWKQGLKDRSKAFHEELGLDEPLSAAAWVTQIDGENTLCISMGLAEKVLRPELITSEWYGEDYKKHDMATLEHEYTHTQGGINLDSGIEFGIALEELRAEHFSGNMMGYQEIKGHYNIDYLIATGQQISELFDKNPKGGSAEDIYSAIAEKVGMDRMLEVVMAQPNVYVDEQSNIFSREVQDFLGGFDGVIEHIMADKIAQGQQDQINNRLRDRAERIIDVTEGNPEFYLSYRRGQGLELVSTLLEEEISRRMAA